MAVVGVAELFELRKAARRRWSAAKVLLTSARKGDSAARIAAAQNCSERAYVEFTRISEAVICEAMRINRARTDQTRERYDRMCRTWYADPEVPDARAVAWCAPPTGEQR